VLDEVPAFAHVDLVVVVRFLYVLPDEDLAGDLARCCPESRRVEKKL